ncbi:MAG: PhzF family phenazine biosynthesis protein [Pseudomonadota bacterium]
MIYPVDWVDAFTNRAFGGNGCAVVHDGGAVPPDQCATFTAETGLVECTFIDPPETAEAHAKVRYFMASGEIPFAGHPTVASVASLLHRGLIEGDSVCLETGAGLIDVRIDRTDAAPWIEMTQIAPEFGPAIPASEVASAVGLSTADIVGQPQVVSTGLPFCVTLVKDHETLARAHQTAALADFANTHAIPGVDLVYPYLLALGGATNEGDTFARLLLGPPLPPEDPFTGSATGATAAYLWRHGLIPEPKYVAEQGHGMGRPGRARVEVLGPPEAIEGVKVSGQAFVLMSGQLMLNRAQ